MTYRDINGLGISKENRTDAPSIDHASERNQTKGVVRGIIKNLQIFLDKIKRMRQKNRSTIIIIA